MTKEANDSMIDIKNKKGEVIESVSKYRLAGRDLRNTNLRNIDLSDIDLSYTDLSWADMTGTDLNHTNLSDTKLVNTNLSRANLSVTDLTLTNLTGANLTGAKLTNAELTGATLKNCIGNMNEVISLQIENWRIVATKDVLCIGCRQYSIKEWKTFSNIYINAMDVDALDFWEKWKDFIFLAIKIKFGV